MVLSGEALANAELGAGPLAQWRQVAQAERAAVVLRWLLVLCLAYICGAAVTWPSTYYEMARTYLSQLGALSLLSFFAVIIPAAMIISPRTPARFILTSLRSNGLRAALIVTFFTLSLAAFTTYKVNIPDIVPFYSDKALADIGELLHGQAPWRITHAFDSDALAMVVALAYSRFWFLEWFGLVFFAALFGNQQQVHVRYLVALALTVLVVGTLLATLFSSVGPIFYDEFLNSDRYAELLEVLRQRPGNEHVLLYSDYLLTNYRADTPALGTGISAMPSVHVAIATLNAFYLARLNRWLGVAGWAFAILILFGSVYTGWHYAVDGYIAMLVVAAIWKRTEHLVSWPAIRIKLDPGSVEAE